MSRPVEVHYPECRKSGSGLSARLAEASEVLNRTDLSVPNYRAGAVAMLDTLAEELMGACDCGGNVDRDAMFRAAERFFGGDLTRDSGDTPFEHLPTLIEAIRRLMGKGR